MSYRSKVIQFGKLELQLFSHGKAKHELLNLRKILNWRYSL
jgi:hypothetical protein